jgi:hypothetical protein
MLENLEQQLSVIPNIESILIIAGIFIILIVFKAVALKQDLQDEARQNEFQKNVSKIPKSTPAPVRKTLPAQKASVQSKKVENLGQMMDAVKKTQKDKGNKAMSDKELREVLRHHGLNRLFSEDDK